MSYPFHRVNVFTMEAFGGNPLAVFPRGHEVPEELMQRIAQELNLSETTFVLPPPDDDHDFHVRIFTPVRELPMAGHPTVGTAWVLARTGRIPRSADVVTVRFLEGVGTIPVEIHFEGDEPTIAVMDQPLPEFGPAVDDREALADLLSLAPEDLSDQAPAQDVSCGNHFLIVPLASLAAVRSAAVKPHLLDEVLRGVEARMILVYCREVENPGSTVHSRMFASTFGVAEDPATGSAAGPLGSYLSRHDLLEGDEILKLRNEQGIEMGRPSFLDVEIHRQGREITRVRVSGATVPMGTGLLTPGEWSS